MGKPFGQADVSPKAHITRSPNYPALTLEKAIEKVAVLSEKYGRHSVPKSPALALMGYTAESSAGLQCIAALRAFGLIDIYGTGDRRQLTITERASRIVGNHSTRIALLRDAALNPRIHSEIWQRFYKSGIGLAPDDAIREYLLHDRADGTFNKQSVDGFIEQLKQTISFAKLDEGDIIEGDGMKGDDDGPSPSDKQKRQRLHVSGTKEDIFTLDEGQVVLQWPASLSEESFRDLEDWLKLALRKIGRAVVQNKQTSDQPC